VVIGVHMQITPNVLWITEGEHLRSTITSLVEIICFQRQPNTWISMGYTSSSVWANIQQEYGRVVKLESTWKW
jgi:hypothetical protein